MVVMEGGANQHFKKHSIYNTVQSPDIILLFVGVNKKRWEYYQQPRAEAEVHLTRSRR